MACPPSHRYEQQFPEQPSSIYAEEGSFAHSLAELELEHQLGTISAALYSAELEAHKENEWYSLVLQGHVDAYVSYALQTIAEAQASSATPVVVKVEDSVRVVGWAPTVKGTADLLLVSDTEVHIIDFKYGRGIPVKSESNPQLMLCVTNSLSSTLFFLRTRGRWQGRCTLSVSSRFGSKLPLPLCADVRTFR